MLYFLTHWGWVMHICVSKLTIIGSDNGLAPDRRQAIIWINAGILLIGPLGINLSEILNDILTFSLKKMRLKVLSVKQRPFCLGLNVLSDYTNKQCHTLLGLLSLTWINFDTSGDNWIHKVWVEISCPFPNFNGEAVEVWEWISNFIPNLTRNVVTYPYWD